MGWKSILGLKKRKDASSAERLLNRFLQMQEQVAPQLVVEIGAHDAAFSRRARIALPESRIVAFEASPPVFEHFSRAVDFESERIEYLHSAISDNTGETTFLMKVRGKNAHPLRGTNSLMRKTAGGGNYSETRVPATTIDDFFQSYDFDRCSLWVDAEGATSKVLTGATKTLARTYSALIEVEDEKAWENQWLSNDVISFMRKAGLEPIDRDYEYTNQYNIIFARPLNRSTASNQ